MPIFDVKVPENAQVLISGLTDVATFDLPYINVVSIFGEKYFPNINDTFIDEDGKEELIKRLEPVGYDSHYLAKILGSIYIFMLLTVVCLIIIVILEPIKKSVGIARKIQQKLIDFFCWNFIMRLLIETCIEIQFAIQLKRPYFW